MAGGRVESLVREFSENAALELGLELVDVEYVKEGGNWVLRIFIDKEGGVSTTDCERLSRTVEKILDEKDPIETAYSLEVSSAGLDRALKKDEDFERFKGRLVNIKLYKTKFGGKKHIGELLGLKDDIISIENEEGSILEFEKSEVSLVRLEIVL